MVEQSIGHLSADAAREIGNHYHSELRIDLERAMQEVIGLKLEAGVVPWPAHVVIRHNGLTNSDCHECGGGGLEAEVFVTRPPTDDELRADERREAERKDKAERRRRRDYERLRARYGDVE